MLRGHRRSVEYLAPKAAYAIGIAPSIRDLNTYFRSYLATLFYKKRRYWRTQFEKKCLFSELTAHSHGYEHGYQEALSCFSQGHKRSQSLLTTLREETLHLAKLIAEHVLQNEITINSALHMEALKMIQKRLPISASTIIRVHPHDLKKIYTFSGDLGQLARIEESADILEGSLEIVNLNGSIIIDWRKRFSEVVDMISHAIQQEEYELR